MVSPHGAPPGDEVGHPMTAPPPGPSDEGYDPRTGRDRRRVEEEAPGVSRHEPIGLRERLPLNRMGTFDRDLDRGFMERDPGALDVFDLRPGEDDGAPLSLAGPVPAQEVRGGLPLGPATAAGCRWGRPPTSGRTASPLPRDPALPGIRGDAAAVHRRPGRTARPGISAGMEALSEAVRTGPADLEEPADHLSAQLGADPPLGPAGGRSRLGGRHGPPAAAPGAGPGTVTTTRLRQHVHQADPAGAAEVRSALRRTLDP